MQLHLVDGHVVLIAAVLGVVPYSCIGTVHLEHVLCIVKVAVSLDPLDSGFLNRAAVAKRSLLENGERVLPLLLVDVGQADSHYQCVNELIVVVAIHGIEQSIHGCRDRLLGWARDALLEVVGSSEPDSVCDGYIVLCHLIQYLLGS